MTTGEQLLAKSILSTGTTLQHLQNIVPNNGTGKDIAMNFTGIKNITIQKNEKYVTMSVTKTKEITMSKSEKTITVSNSSKNINIS